MNNSSQWEQLNGTSLVFACSCWLISAATKNLFWPCKQLNGPSLFWACSHLLDSASLMNLFSQGEQLNGLSLLWAGSCLLNLVVEWISLHKGQLNGLLLECTLHVLLESSVHVYSILIHLSSGISSWKWRVLLGHDRYPILRENLHSWHLLSRLHYWQMTHHGSSDCYSLLGLTIISQLRNIQKILLKTNNKFDYGEYTISEQQNYHKQCTVTGSCHPQLTSFQ